MSEQSLESNREPDGSVHPGLLQSRHKSPCTQPSWDPCYIPRTDSIQRGPIIVRNPAVVEELELDGDEVDPADVAPFTSGNAPIITVPASEDEEADVEVVVGGAEGGCGEMEDMYHFLGELSEKIQAFNSTMQGSVNSSQPPVVPDDKLWDTELAWEQYLYKSTTFTYLYINLQHLHIYI